VKFWDSSALVPLLVVDEQMSPRVVSIYDSDLEMVVWWGTPIECVSALARLEREQRLDASHTAKALQRLADLRGGWQEIDAVEKLRDIAIRLTRVHPLRAADSMQLAAAIVASENRPSSLDFVCLDQRLISAAEREGFAVISTVS
jgi:predicted nucleic acid-binding protein